MYVVSVNDKRSEEILAKRFEIVAQLEIDLSRETDRGCALMAAEYCSTTLRGLLEAAFVEDRKAVAKVLDDAKGGLSSFAERIDFAYLMGLLSPSARRELHLIRSIRNAFAHEYRPLTSAKLQIDVAS